ncbi:MULTISPECIES: alpha/beta family hydrolase [unclassified Guyparkeria]|uniref:dienelactone hydrolase family protein n=1 Tax=unclassified Guyparkeria TaxID=2626246 RepID=UPI0007333AE8|nr:MULTISPECIES: alpha/beta family hydrolase [unclassified Guyparkeria]KTG17701.1 hydrolase [Guyparkeria sp. XI15]OAE88514.1 hydrolase [Guyparkeria sp. WRN-7]
MSDAERAVQMRLGGGLHEGILGMPRQPRGLVVFAHGSGSSRHSARNQFVARQLHEVGMGTLLFDLLSEEEDRVYENRFDIDRLAERLVQASGWVADQPELADLPRGYFGASTGAAAALKAAARLPDSVRAVVSRGGRPDLAGEALPQVKAPTLLIVGGADTQVIELNSWARERMRATSEMAIVPGATHLFEEPGTLFQAAQLAADWFTRWLVPA